MQNENSTPIEKSVSEQKNEKFQMQTASEKKTTVWMKKVFFGSLLVLYAKITRPILVMRRNFVQGVNVNIADKRDISG